ncbi:hypothetical protein BO78DRAFT_194544 [Aspergillus sclerotiicarbonarius CBS 121057]|uniref:Uncharacterized protein n=1 Tax=Aspergillus sclerotiicarbonarius (strain CBS 121057 / IBT 28362) TaxID=1448318 RepID=A0A319E1W3_ASPSB|nr:hypothetical protein BO78DRAFT_194544 [Aspergillus sclerotiicarbonarius CBS 121057]
MLKGPFHSLFTMEARSADERHHGQVSTVPYKIRSHPTQKKDLRGDSVSWRKGEQWCQRTNPGRKGLQTPRARSQGERARPDQLTRTRGITFPPARNEGMGMRDWTRQEANKDGKGRWSLCEDKERVTPEGGILEPRRRWRWWR